MSNGKYEILNFNFAAALKFTMIENPGTGNKVYITDTDPFTYLTTANDF